MTQVKHVFAPALGKIRFNCPIKTILKPNFRGYRPDLWWDLETHGLIVEVDEYQHKRYNKEAERIRTTQIQLDANKPVVFLRFNPDGYIDNNNVWQKTCFSDRGVAKTKQNEWEQRMDILMTRMIAFKYFIPEQSVTEEFLFFDKNTGIVNKHHG